MPTLDDAIILAAEAHRGQRDKHGQPYIFHPVRVMLKVEGEAERIAGVLHDVVEDTPIVPDDLSEKGYPPQIVEAVDALSKRAGESYMDYIERVCANPIAVKVKMADLEDNLALPRTVNLSDEDLDKIKTKIKAYRRLRKQGR